MDNVDTEKLIRDMTEALDEARDVQDVYSRTLEQLEKENRFLANTIEQYKIGKIITERRELHIKLSQAETNSAKAINDASAIQNEYNGKLDKLSAMIKDVQDKQDNINSYIDTESEKKIADTKRSLNNKFRAEDKKLHKDYRSMEVKINDKLRLYRIVTIISILITVLTVAISHIF